MFVDRKQEIAFLNSILKRDRPTPAQMVLIYGRRRVGKTVLARHWAESTTLPTIYWAAEREPAGLQRRKLYARMLGVPLAQSPTFEAWADLWTAFARMLNDRRQILILDEVPHAAESDPAFLSALQHAWDQQLKNSRLVLLLCGSHVHTMETFLARGSPLFGRFTGQWHLEPLEFGALRHFLPKWTIEERVEAYAIVGGVPAYLEWLRPEASLMDNVRNVILAPGSMFVAEPELLLYDEVREPRVYQAILQAIGGGAHTLDTSPMPPWLERPTSRPIWRACRNCDSSNAACRSRCRRGNARAAAWGGIILPIRSYGSTSASLRPNARRWAIALKMCSPTSGSIGGALWAGRPGKSCVAPG